VNNTEALPAAHTTEWGQNYGQLLKSRKTPVPHRRFRGRTLCQRLGLVLVSGLASGPVPVPALVLVPVLVLAPVSVLVPVSVSVEVAGLDVLGKVTNLRNNAVV
jgi:hypothetical protein